jgi:hypothetical protein
VWVSLVSQGYDCFRVGCTNLGAKYHRVDFARMKLHKDLVLVGSFARECHSPLTLIFELDMLGEEELCPYLFRIELFAKKVDVDKFLECG